MKRPFGTYNPIDPVVQENTTGLGFIIKPFYFILLMWVVFWLDQRFMLGLYRFGILPRDIAGIIGVVTTPLLHGSMGHLANNTLPILALGAGLYYFYPRIASKVVLISWISSGMAVWLIGRESFHIGASGLIYALAGFIFLSGILRRQPNLLALSLLVVFLYGGLIWGILPIEEAISWEAHLAGAFSGFALAINYRQMGPARTKRYSWELEEEEEVEDIESSTLMNGGEQVQQNGVKPEETWTRYSNEPPQVMYHYRPRVQPPPPEKDNEKK